MPTPMRDIELEETYLGYSVRSMRSKWLIFHTTTEHDEEHGDYPMRWYLAEQDEDGRVMWTDSMFNDEALIFTKREAERHVEEHGLEAEVIELLKAARP